MKPVVLLSALAVLLSATAASAQTFRPWSPAAAARAAGRQIFMEHCAVCHAWNTSVPVAQGPSLVGIVGRPAASQPGFPYSEGLRKSGIVWTEDNLRKWIADSAHMVPDTPMPHVSISDPAEQVFVVEFLKTLKPPNGVR